MLAWLNKEDLLRLSAKAKMVSRAPPKLVVAPTSSEDDEDTTSGFVFTRKRGRAQATSPRPSPSWGQVASNVAPPHNLCTPQLPCHVLVRRVQRVQGEKAFGTRVLMSLPSWRMLSCALRTRREWIPIAANTFCKRLWSNLDRLWPRVAWPWRKCGIKRLPSNKTNKTHSREWRTWNRKFKKSEPFTKKPSNYWRPRLKRPLSRRLA